MDLRHVDSNKRKRFFIGLGAAILIVVAFSYLKFSASGIIGRSTDPLSGTEWIAWSGDSLKFSENTVDYATAKSSGSYPYEEQAGAVKLLEGGKVYKVFLRFNMERLISENGQTVFYLRSVLPEDTSEEVTGDEEA